MRLCGILSLLAIALSGMLAWGADPLPAPVFGDHPRVAYTAKEIAAWKADPARQEEIRQLLAQGDALLAKEFVIPQKEGQWIFYYACPKHDATLTPETPERHVCPVCREVFTDEQTNAAYRTQQNYQLDNNCLTLATCYALSGNERYAARVRSSLLELARLYPTFERHDRWGRRGLAAVVGGRRYCQLLDEAVQGITLAKAYDLIAASPALTAEDRTTIEQKLLGDNAREILRFQAFIGSRNNHQTWFNATYTTVGLAIGDAELMRAGIEGKVGFLWQLTNSVTNDGIWFEGTMAYHFYALQAIMDTLFAASRAGWDFRANPRVKSLWLGPVQLAYPNGQFPVMNDSDPATLSGYQRFYQWALDYFQDPAFTAYAGKAAGAPVTSADLTDIGLAVLRRGTGKTASCAMVDYGQHGGGHGHPDKLNLLLYGLGRELLLDPGRISYSVPEYKTWCRTTVAHNTVVIDGVDQKADTGRCLYFAETKEYSAALTASDSAYPGWALRRYTVLTGSLLIDVFTVRGQKEAQLDWFAHTPGTLETTLPLAERTNPLGAENGYQHLAKLKEGNGAARMTVTVKSGPENPLRIWCIDDANSTVFTGEGIGYNLSQRVPFLLRRRTAAATTFITIYDLSGDGSVVTEVSKLPVKLNGKPAPETDACALRIRSTTTTLLIALDLRDEPKGEMKVEKKTVKRCLVVSEK